MGNPYSTLNLLKEATTSEVESAYHKLSKVEHHIGDDTYDYYHRIFKAGEAYNAYKILGDRCKRFKYDIDHYDKIEYVDFDFKDSSEIEKFINTLLEELYIQKSNVKLKDELIKGLDKRVQLQLDKNLQDKTTHNIELQLEINKRSDIVREMNDLFKKIEFLEAELKILENIQKEKAFAENSRKLIEIQNTRLLKLAKNHRNNLFKVSTIIISAFIFIIIILLINLL